MAKRPPVSAAARTISLFGEPAGQGMLTFTAPERITVGGFAPPPPGQVGLFGPQQMDIGDKERLARSQAFKAAPASAKPAPDQETIDEALRKVSLGRDFRS